MGFQNPDAVAKSAALADKQGEFCYGLPGSVAPFENFDPFNFLDGKTFEQVRTWREAELAHCRVGMLAAAGFLVQEKFRTCHAAPPRPIARALLPTHPCAPLGSSHWCS